MNFQGQAPLDDYISYFMSRVDGYKPLKVLLPFKIEQFYSFRKVYNPPKTVFMNGNISEYCPDIIHTIEKDDQLSIDDSDEEDIDFFKVDFLW